MGTAIFLGMLGVTSSAILEGRHPTEFTGGATATLNQGRVFIALKPQNERNASIDQVINRLQKTKRRNARADRCCSHVRQWGQQTNSMAAFESDGGPGGVVTA